MGKRGKQHYGIWDIAKATGMSYRSTLRHEKEKRFIYGDIGSVAEYIMSFRRGGHHG